MNYKFRGQTILFLVLVFTTGCSNPGVQTQGAVPSETLPVEHSQFTPSPEKLVEPEGEFTRTKDSVKMVYVPGGTFPMGSTTSEIEDAISLCSQHYSPCNRWYYERESPQHRVTLDDYWIDQAEVSNDQYRLCIDAGVCEAPNTCKKGSPTINNPDKSNHPVVCVDWEDAQAYCNWVGGRLPTEAEWEYAFRGEAGSIYPWGDEFDGSRLNYCDKNCSQTYADDRFDDGYAMTAPVGSYPSGVSWSKVYNMGGNVFEWVSDWMDEYEIEAVSNPSGPLSGSEKMVKGCSWFYNPAYCRGAARPSVSPDTRFDYLGFRCAMSPDQKTEIAEATTDLEFLIAPQGQAAVIDGTISPNEWDDAFVENFADGSELFLKQDGEFIFVGIKAMDNGMIAANVFIQLEDRISILHSSAALGTAIYQDEGNGGDGWGQVQDFQWCCRNAGDSESAQVEREEFLQEDRWLASIGPRGTPNELEYQIRIPEQDFRIAAVFIRSKPPYEKIPWPASLDDDCIKPTEGGLPEVLNFNPENWIMVKLSN